MPVVVPPECAGLPGSDWLRLERHDLPRSDRLWLERHDLPWSDRLRFKGHDATLGAREVGVVLVGVHVAHVTQCPRDVIVLWIQNLSDLRTKTRAFRI